jgi:hypothetical protein
MRNRPGHVYSHAVRRYNPFENVFWPPAPSVSRAAPILGNVIYLIHLIYLGDTCQYQSGSMNIVLVPKSDPGACLGMNKVEYPLVINSDQDRSTGSGCSW